MDASTLRLLFVLGLICSALAEDNSCECTAGEIAALAAGGAVAAVAAAPFAIAAAGFTSAGIAAASFGSWLMSVAAVANGGGVVAGGVVATLQSAGVIGLGAAGKAGVAATGGSVLAATCRKLKCG